MRSAYLPKPRNEPELWCWRRLSRVPWTARRSNQFILKDISPEYPLEGLMLKLKLQYFGHLMQRTDSLEKTWCWERLKAGREEDEMVGWHTNSMDMSLSNWTSSRRWWWTGKPGVLHSMGLQRVRHTGATEQQLMCSLPVVPSLEIAPCVLLGRMNQSCPSPPPLCSQASLPIRNSQSFLKIVSIELVTQSNHLILCHPLLLLPSIFPSIRVFSNESVLRIRRPKY